MFYVEGYHWFIEQDDYCTGCIPGTGSDQFIKYPIKAGSIDELIKIISEQHDVNRQAMSFNPTGDEPNHLSFGYLVDANNHPATINDISAWQDGKLQLWYGVATYLVYELVPVKLPAR